MVRMMTMLAAFRPSRGSRAGSRPPVESLTLQIGLLRFRPLHLPASPRVAPDGFELLSHTSSTGRESLGRIFLQHGSRGGADGLRLDAVGGWSPGGHGTHTTADAREHAAEFTLDARLAAGSTELALCTLHRLRQRRHAPTLATELGSDAEKTSWRLVSWRLRVVAVFSWV